MRKKKAKIVLFNERKDKKKKERNQTEIHMSPRLQSKINIEKWKKNRKRKNLIWSKNQNEENKRENYGKERKKG